MLHALFAPLVQKPEHEVNDNQHVYDEADDFESRSLVHELVDLERNERSRDDHGQILGPATAQQQTRTFDQEHNRIDERADAHFLEPSMIETGNFGDGFDQQRLAWVYPELAQRGSYRVNGVVLEDQLECADAQRDEQNGFDQFE